MSGARPAWGARLGAVPSDGVTTFRVWAPGKTRVAVAFEGQRTQHELHPESDGCWALTLAGVCPGKRYGYLVDGDGPFPDPCSRAQPDGVSGLSEVVDPAAFPWSDWQRPPFHELVIYECHIGTLTAEGTFDSAIAELARLREMGLTAIEVMPVASFAGRWNWGYDGAALFAPDATYGGPEGLRRLVDAAHGAGLAVILDVVYNHFGPDGNYTGRYADEYLTESHHTPWGGALNFGAPGVRDFVRENVLHWVHEYHIDGFRLDATHWIFDDSPVHILAELTESADSARLPGCPRPYFIAETHENAPRYIRPVASGGFGFDGIWADDFHHAAWTMLDPGREGYLAGFDGTARTLAKTIAQGMFFEGQVDIGVGEPRGKPARDIPWPSFVYCLQNHDQVGNRAFGDRISDIGQPGAVRALTLILLLLPQTPVVFQGEEFDSPAPFLYFTDHHEELGAMVTAGRREEFAALYKLGPGETLPDPQDAESFQRSKLDSTLATEGEGRTAAAFRAALLTIRAKDPVLAAYRRERLRIAAAWGESWIELGFETPEGKRCIVANFGDEDVMIQLRDGGWRLALHTEEVRFGGSGVEPRVGERSAILPPRSAAILENH